MATQDPGTPAMTKSPRITRTTQEIRHEVQTARGRGKRIALVPTMGALHEGHLSLIDFARTMAYYVAVSIFVNPAQFGAGEDFEDYPRTWDRDIAALEKRGVDAVYAPTAKTMYPQGFATAIHVEGPALELETTYRPHFFGGVAIVVTKLLLGVLPDVAILGEKDYQQLLVIKQMVRDLEIPCRIEGAPTLREADGLAMSSRNAYLSADERPIAAKLHEVLQACAAQIKTGHAPETSLSEAIATLSALGFKVDYVELRNAETLKKVSDINTEPLRLLAAARLGKPRLIDNIPV